jgi:hypothetical protein
VPRIWRDPHTLQLGLDPARAVLLDLPDPRAARILDLLDGARPERVVLRRAAERGISLDDARALLDTLHAAGFVLPAPALLPTLADDARRRLTGEAAALAIERATARLPLLHAHAAHQQATAPPATGRRAAADHPATAPAATDQPAATHQRSTAPATARPTPPPATGTPARVPHQRTIPAKARRQPSGSVDAAVQGPGGRSPAAILRRRLTARVVVTGHGRLGAGLAVALAEAGVGHVHPELPGAVTLTELAGGPLRGADVGSPRREAVVSALRRAVPGVETRPVRRGGANLVVQLGSDQPTALVAAAHASRRQAHLAVSVHDGVAVVGPFVPPSGAPCLLCVELHRRDRDARRPEPVDRLDPAELEPCPVATLLMATGFAAAEVLAYLDGGMPETLGASVEITTPGRLRRRSWMPHPACGCRRSPGRPR